MAESGTPTPCPAPGSLSQDTQADAHLCDPKSNPKCDHPDSDATLAKRCLMVVLKKKNKTRDLISGMHEGIPTPLTHVLLDFLILITCLYFVILVVNLFTQHRCYLWDQKTKDCHTDYRVGDQSHSVPGVSLGISAWYSAPCPPPHPRLMSSPVNGEARVCPHKDVDAFS